MSQQGARSRTQTHGRLEPEEKIHVTIWACRSSEGLGPSTFKLETQGERVMVQESNESYSANKVFGLRATQNEVITSLMDLISADVDAGYNSTLLVYGQSGRVKTSAMHGKRSSNTEWEKDPDAGIIPRTLSEIFEKLEKRGSKFSVKVSFLQIYNEGLYDLLNPSPGVRKTLQMFEDPIDKRSVIVKGLKNITVRDKNEAYRIWENGEATLMNHHFSQSHVIFSLTLYMTETIDGELFIQIGKINLVDVAGSENMGGSAAVDTAEDKSLVNLHRVIAARAAKETYIPYGDSKLTRLLQDSLEGRTKTYILAIVAPASKDVQVIEILTVQGGELQKDQEVALEGETETRASETTEDPLPGAASKINEELQAQIADLQLKLIKHEDEEDESQGDEDPADQLL